MPPSDMLRDADPDEQYSLMMFSKHIVTALIRSIIHWDVTITNSEMLLLIHLMYCT